MKDIMLRAVSHNARFRLFSCDSTSAAQEICRLHQTSPTASIALGRAVAAAALMGAQLKNGQRVALKFEGNGPMRKLIAEADSDGAVRASVANPAAEAEPVNGRWNVPGVLGRAGFLTVTKDLGMKEPYRGMVQLRTSEIGDDLAYYLTGSEQIPSAVGLGVALDETGAIAACGGFLVQAMPGADEEDLERMMASISALPPLSGLLRDGGPKVLLEKLLDDIPFNLLETREIFFRCGCSPEKVEQALVSLGNEELRDMLEKEGQAEVSCEFCRRIYRFGADELERLL